MRLERGAQRGSPSGRCTIAAGWGCTLADVGSWPGRRCASPRDFSRDAPPPRLTTICILDGLSAPTSAHLRATAREAELVRAGDAAAVRQDPSSGLSSKQASAGPRAPTLRSTIPAGAASPRCRHPDAGDVAGDGENLQDADRSPCRVAEIQAGARMAREDFACASLPPPVPSSGSTRSASMIRRAMNTVSALSPGGYLPSASRETGAHSAHSARRCW